MSNNKNETVSMVLRSKNRYRSNSALAGLASMIFVLLLANAKLGLADGMNRIVWPYRFNNDHYTFLGELVYGFESAYPKEAKLLKCGSDDKASVGKPPTPKANPPPNDSRPPQSNFLSVILRFRYPGYGAKWISLWLLQFVKHKGPG